VNLIEEIEGGLTSCTDRTCILLSSILWFFQLRADVNCDVQSRDARWCLCDFSRDSTFTLERTQVKRGIVGSDIAAVEQRSRREGREEEEQRGLKM